MTGTAAVVVGSGVIGAAAALELTRLGLQTVVIDKARGPRHDSDQRLQCADAIQLLDYRWYRDRVGGTPTSLR